MIPDVRSVSAVAGYSGGLLGRRILFWSEGREGVEASQGNAGAVVSNGLGDAAGRASSWDP